MSTSSPEPATKPSQKPLQIPFLPKVFYGWLILAAGTATSSLNGATNTYGLGLFFVPLIREFGWTRAQLAGALSLARLEGGAIGPLEGWLTDKLGPRLMWVGIPMVAMGFYLLSRLSDVMSLLSFIEPLFVFYAVYVLFVALGSSMTGQPASNALVHWWVRRRGMAMGVQSTGLAMGAGLYLPFLGYIIENSGWRQAALTASMIALAIGIPAALVMRRRPEDHGLLPDGDKPGDATEQSGPRRARGQASDHEFTLREAMHTSAFWVIAFSFSARIMCTTGITLHLSPLMIDRGFSLTEAAWVLSANALLSGVGRFSLGFIGDKVERRLLYMWSLVPMVIGIVILALSTEMWQVMLFLLLYSPCYGGSVTVISAMRADYFGVRSYSTIGGAMGPITTFGTVIGPLFAGFMFDTFHTYQTAFLIFAGCIVLNILFLQLLKRPVPQTEQATAA